MEDIFTLPQITESEKTEHEKGVQRIRDALTRLNLPVLPAHIICCESYHPDAATRIEGDSFTIFDYINSQGQFCFDIGGLFLLLAHKDIIEAAVAVVGKGVFPELVERVRKHRSPFLQQLVIVPESELDAFLQEKTKDSNLWRPENLS